MQATWCVTAMDIGLVRVMTIENEGNNGPNHPSTSPSQAARMSTFSDWHATGYQTPHSPLRSPSHSPSQNCHRPHTSGSSVSSFSSSSPTKSESDTESLCGDSPDIVFVGKTGDDNSSDGEETVSPLDISNLDTEEIQMAAACRKVRQNDALFTTWRDLQIHQGNYEIGRHDQSV